MIKNKNQLKIKLKENKESLLFETIRNDVKPERIGTQRKVGKVQTNAFTLLTENQKGEFFDSWTWYNDNIKIENNVISYLDNKGNPFVQIKIIEIA